MKWLLGIVLSIVLVEPVYSDDFARLRMKIGGTAGDNRYFLCVSNVGCTSIVAGNHGKEFPMTEGKLNYIYTLNIKNLRVYHQPLPETCNIDVKNGQTVVVRGNIRKSLNNGAIIDGLHCSIS